MPVVQPACLSTGVLACASRREAHMHGVAGYPSARPCDTCQHEVLLGVQQLSTAQQGAHQQMVETPHAKCDLQCCKALYLTAKSFSCCQLQNKASTNCMRMHSTIMCAGTGLKALMPQTAYNHPMHTTVCWTLQQQICEVQKETA